MNTDSGRIYDPDEYAERRNAAKAGVDIDEHQREFERAYREGKVVGVSEEVARLVKTGQRVEDRRAKRRAARAARKKNRS